MSENALPDEVKAFIVESLACFDAPSAVARAVKEQFGIEVSRQNVHAYDPTKAAASGLGERWRVLFKATREGFVAGAQEVGIQHRATRLRMLERLIERAESSRNNALVAQLLVQAAKEVGDVYTNRSRVDANHSYSHEDALDALDGDVGA